MLNFFDPAWIVNGKPYKSYKYEQVLKEELLIAYLSKGSISVNEIDNLPINDRKILLSTLRQAEDAKKKRLEELKQQRSMKSNFGKH